EGQTHADEREPTKDHVDEPCHYFTKNPNRPLTTWPSVERTCHSTRYRPGARPDTGAVSQSGGPSARSGRSRAFPRSSTSRTRESRFSIRLLKRRRSSVGGALRALFAAGDDSSKSEWASAEATAKISASRTPGAAKRRISASRRERGAWGPRN